MIDNMIERTGIGSDNIAEVDPGYMKTTEYFVITSGLGVASLLMLYPWIKTWSKTLAAYFLVVGVVGLTLNLLGVGVSVVNT